MDRSVTVVILGGVIIAQMFVVGAKSEQIVGSQLASGLRVR
jgi:hypothetical protein